MSVLLRLPRAGPARRGSQPAAVLQREVGAPPSPLPRRDAPALLQGAPLGCRVHNMCVKGASAFFLGGADLGCGGAGPPCAVGCGAHRAIRAGAGAVPPCRLKTRRHNDDLLAAPLVSTPQSIVTLCITEDIQDVHTAPLAPSKQPETKQREMQALGVAGQQQRACLRRPGAQQQRISSRHAGAARRPFKRAHAVAQQQQEEATAALDFGTSKVQGPRPTMEDVLRLERGLPGGLTYAGGLQALLLVTRGSASGC